MCAGQAIGHSGQGLIPRVGADLLDRANHYKNNTPKYFLYILRPYISPKYFQFTPGVFLEI
jgi:hypothetical protein